MPSAAESFVRSLLERAILENATDVHLEPFENAFHVRLRTPRGLVQLPSPDKALFGALVRHLKLMSRLDIAEEALPQDGKFVWTADGAQAEFRLSFLPTLYGPSVVLRVLDSSRTPLILDALGFNEEILVQLKRALELPFGLVAVVGRTGSGKTTTLYACLRQLARGRTRKILSIEDPVEVALEGVQQVSVGHHLSFAAALRAFLRHDPDVIFVGEIRDRETARLAIQAALTGHLVLASLHARSVQDVPARLADLGVEGYLIASALKFVLCQELQVNERNERVPTAEAWWPKETVAKEAYAQA